MALLSAAGDSGTVAAVSSAVAAACSTLDQLLSHGVFVLGPPAVSHTPVSFQLSVLMSFLRNA
jgi:hypothetical protein